MNKINVVHHTADDCIFNTLVQIIVLFYSKKSFWKVTMPLICITGLIAPLFLVDPLGPRNFFVIYVLEMIETFYILNEAKFDYEDFSGTTTN